MMIIKDEKCRNDLLGHLQVHWKFFVWKISVIEYYFNGALPVKLFV